MWSVRRMGSVPSVSLRVRVPSRLGVDLPSPPFPNRACGSPAHGFPPGSRSCAFRRATGVGGRPERHSQSVDLSRGASGWIARWTIPRSSLVASHTWLEALRSNRVMLSRSSSLLLPPPTSVRHFAVSQGRWLSTSWLPGTEGWRPAALCLPASRRISPVPGTTVWPFRAPCAGRFLDTRSKIPGVVHGLRPLGKGSTPPAPPSLTDRCNDAAGFT